MNFIRNRNFRGGPQTSLEGFICPQNSDKQQKIKVFGRSDGGASLLRSVFGMLGADVVSNEIVHVEFYAEKASESIPTHAKITLNDFNIFIVSKWEGMTSASLQKYSKDILVNKRDKLLYITSESQCQIVDMSDQVLCTNYLSSG